MRKIGYVMLAAVLSTLPSNAAFQDGNKLYEACQERPKDFCLGYVMGITDVMQTGTVNGFKACMPTNVTGNQVVDIVTAYLRKNPANRHYDAPGIVAIALGAAFPCPP